MGTGVSKQQLRKLFKRVSYIEARSKFQKLTKDEQENKLWNTCPITTNFRVSPLRCYSNRKLEVLKCRWTSCETDGKVGPEKWEVDNDGRRNSLRYILANKVECSSLQNRYNGKPLDFVLGLDFQQYQSLFFPTRSLTTQPSSSISPALNSNISDAVNVTSERKIVGLYEVAG